MKKLFLVVAIILSVSVLFVGCGKNNDSTASGNNGNDAQKTFANAVSLDDASFSFKLLNDNTYEISAKDKSNFSTDNDMNNLPTNLVIPSTYNGLPVSQIAEGGFNYCVGIKSLTIPNGITSIGGYSFKGCKNLTSVSLPEGLISIDGAAFYGCTALTDINIPNDVAYVGGLVFNGCNNLRYTEYDNGLYLGNSQNPYFAFAKAKNTSITSCKISDKTKMILSSAFHNCNALTDIEIPDNITFIGKEAFSQCCGLTSIQIPNSVTYFGDGVFYGCTGLQTVTLSTNLTSVKEYTFYGCIGLANIVIPSSVETIGCSAFYECKGLKSITIGNNLNSIGENAFLCCEELTEITFNGRVAEWNAVTKGKNWNYNLSATKVTCVDGEVDL